MTTCARCESMQLDWSVMSSPIGNLIKIDTYMHGSTRIHTLTRAEEDHRVQVQEDHTLHDHSVEETTSSGGKAHASTRERNEGEEQKKWHVGNVQG